MIAYLPPIAGLCLLQHNAQLCCDSSLNLLRITHRITLCTIRAKIGSHTGEIILAVELAREVSGESTNSCVPAGVTNKSSREDLSPKGVDLLGDESRGVLQD